jgi:N-acetylglucosamine-6-phosphate deacetylase
LKRKHIENCSAIDVTTGQGIVLSFDRLIKKVESRECKDKLYMAPGFIDLQVNGFGGVDYNDPTSPIAEISRSMRVLLQTGVTRFFPTVITGAPDDMLGAIRNLTKAKEKTAEGSLLEGIHVEGPYISTEDGPRGAHPRRWVRPPDIEEYRRWQDAAHGLIRMVTLSPHWPNAPKYISSLVEDGVTVSIGHTDASESQIKEAIEAGASMSTHLGNGAHRLIQRHPNYIWDQLAEDRLAAGFIADGIHLPGSFLKVAWRAKGRDKTILVTDASAPAGAAPGRYRLGEQDVDYLPDGRVVLANKESLAGSSLRMDQAVGNLVRMLGISLSDSIQTATVNPARAAKIPQRQAGLVAGDRADFVLFRWDELNQRIQIEATYVDGVRGAVISLVEV